MKINWFTNMLLIVGLPLILMRPLGQFYEAITHSNAASFFNLDPHNLFSGYMIGISFIVGLLCSRQNNWRILIIPTIIILFDLWLGSYYDLRFDVAATALGLSTGFIIRKLIEFYAPSIKRT